MPRAEATASRTAAARDAVRLAAGLGPLAQTPEAWNDVLVAALSERCAALGWRRSGDAIRAAAPPAVVARWRRAAVEADRRGQRQLAALEEIVSALGEGGVEPVVLKGLPLSAALYGDPFVREVNDIDLWVPLEARDATAVALGALGWRHAEGSAPWEETWSLQADGETHHLDVHFRLLDHNLAHLGELPVESRPVTPGVERIRAHAGPLVPSYLAAHIAKHRLPPLLWFLDLAMLWEGLTTDEREAARAAAGAWRLRGYLRWGLEMADCTRRFADGDAGAAARLGFRDDGRTDTHPMLRDLCLADGLLDLGRSAVAWAWPPPLRDRPGAFARRCAGRVRSLVTRRGAVTQPYVLR